ncbi:MAG: ABC transporter ATP-binding protein [Dehalococcoidia bacterium]|nr:ABC transporter ATP-binding protein [Dehalococcoidia bacterium]
MNESRFRPFLRVVGLSHSYGAGAGEVHAVKDATFSMFPGDFVALVGPSGSGKTTLLAMLGALLKPTAGRIFLNGEDIGLLPGRKLAAYRRETIGFVFQANNLVPYLTARENLQMMGMRRGAVTKEARLRADRLLEELGVAHRASALATELSGGERQRVAIARALMNEPQLVLVDEPTASLDSERGRQVVEALNAEVKARRVLGLMVTHDRAMASTADRILEMRDGVVSDQTLASVLIGDEGQQAVATKVQPSMWRGGATARRRRQLRSLLPRRRR